MNYLFIYDNKNNYIILMRCIHPQLENSCFMESSQVKIFKNNKKSDR